MKTRTRCRLFHAICHRSARVASSIVCVTLGACAPAASPGAGAAASPAPVEVPDPAQYTPPAPGATWPSASCQEQTEALIRNMTLSEKAAQMIVAWQVRASPEDVQRASLGAILSNGNSAAFATGYENHGDARPAPWAEMVGAYHDAAKRSRLGIPLLYGIDAVHGNNKVIGATIFPHNIGLGAARSAELVEQIGRATAKEVAAIGANWTFAPAAIVARDVRWGRTYESFSEDPALTGRLAAASVRGLQRAPEGEPAIVACVKHFAGDGLVEMGTSTMKPSWTDKHGLLDRGNVNLPEDRFRALAVEHYRPAIEAGALTVMISYSSWNGRKAHGDRHLITDILKGELGFQGFTVGDYEGHAELPGSHADQVVAAYTAGVDMLMDPEKWRETIEVVRQHAGGRLPFERINDAVRRILHVKCEAGLFDAEPNPQWKRFIGSHRELARAAVRPSLVLLKNEAGAEQTAPLPLNKGSKIYVGGSGADDLTRQCGGWTVDWMGAGAQTSGTTVRAAIAKVAQVVESVEQADAAVVVLSEPSYAEWFGDDADITFEPADLEELARARASQKPTVAVMFSGRPMIIAPHLEQADAWVAAWLPGSEGDGVADVLFGDHAPTGKLSHSWPRSVRQLPLNVGDAGYDPLFPFGFGLGYGSSSEPSSTGSAAVD